MSYVPGCSGDVFISYAHRDNEDGWVATLKQRIEEKLKPFVSGAEVWLDDRLRTGDQIKNEIQRRLIDTPVFIAIVSPCYLESEFCMVHELEWFQNQRGKDLIQLMKVPLDRDADVPFPQARYEKLYDATDGHALTVPGLDRTLDKIVWAIASRLRECWAARPRLYLTQVRDEALGSRWTEFRQRLHSEGYAIVPRNVLPTRVLDSQIRKPIEDSHLSIHFRGVRGDTLAQRQLDLAHGVGNLMIILESPPRPDQVPTILSEIQRKLEAQPAPAVYFIYDFYSDGRDDRQISRFCEYIADRAGCQVLCPESGEKCHLYRLRTSAGILLFCGEAPDDWLESQRQVLCRAAALRGDRFVPEVLYRVRKTNGKPQGLHTEKGPRQEWMIERTGEPETDDLLPFLEEVGSAKAGREAVDEHHA